MGACGLYLLNGTEQSCPFKARFLCRSTDSCAASSPRVTAPVVEKLLIDRGAYPTLLNTVTVFPLPSPRHVYLTQNSSIE